MISENTLQLEVRTHALISVRIFLTQSATPINVFAFKRKSAAASVDMIVARQKRGNALVYPQSTRE